MRKTRMQNYSFESKFVGNGTSPNTRQLNSRSNANGSNGSFNLRQRERVPPIREQLAATTASSFVDATMRLDTGQDSNLNASVHESKKYLCHTVASDGEVILENGLRESDIIRLAITLTPEMPAEQLQQALMNLGVCIKRGNCELPNKNFRAIMKMLLNLLDTQQTEVVNGSLHVLGEIVQSEQMKENWSKFLELILLKIIGSYQNGKDTMREIDSIITRIAHTLPLNETLNIVNSVIATGAYPLNLCAVKLLTELVEKQGTEITEIQLDSFVPNLARLTDNGQSMVRKAAVYCIVKLCINMGEDKVKPKLSLLNPSKLRLLNVYIDKMGGRSSGGTSTKYSSA